MATNRASKDSIIQQLSGQIIELNTQLTEMHRQNEALRVKNMDLHTRLVSAAPVRIWTVRADAEGETADGTRVYEFAQPGAAAKFAEGQTCYQRPCVARTRLVTRAYAKSKGLV